MMFVRTATDKIMATYDGARFVEKAVAKAEGSKVLLQTGVDHTTHSEFTLAGDCDAIWADLLGSGHTCLSRI